MQNIITEKLFASLNELERAIGETKQNLLSAKTPRPELVHRIECYEDVLRKQKNLAGTLSQHVKQGDWEQVKRFVDLIRGSSLLIQLDSQSVITEMSQPGSAASTEQYND